MIQKEYVELTDTLIKQIQAREIVLENGNCLIAKVKAEEVTKGGIIKASTETEDYLRGFGRVLSCPRNLRPKDENDNVLDADVHVGDYIVHSHEARYKPYPKCLEEILDIEGIPEDVFYVVQDKDIILRIPDRVLHRKAL